MPEEIQKKKFEGDLNEISPKKLIAETGTVKDIDAFYLTLSLIYNDIKNIHILSNLMSEYTEEPETEGVSFHRGQHAGVFIYIVRLLVSTANEFFVFVEKNQPTINSYDFKLLMKKLPKSVQRDWDELNAIATGKVGSKSTALFQFLNEIRNTATFHYWNALKPLTTNYRKFFYEEPLGENNKKAYYGLGANMEKTRFFYVDPAVETHLNTAAAKYGYSGEQIRKLVLHDIMSKLNIVIRSIVVQNITDKDK